LNAQSDWRWEEGVVDDQKVHIELRYGNAKEEPYENWEHIARIAKPIHHVFAVEWLVTPDSPEQQVKLAKARREIDFFLVELNYTNPWEYACYHCNTASNMYSSVHWSYFPTGSQGERRASKVIHLSAEERKRLFGDSGESGE
jgi:hypothetical protein